MTVTRLFSNTTQSQDTQHIPAVFGKVGIGSVGLTDANQQLNDKLVDGRLYRRGNHLKTKIYRVNVPSDIVRVEDTAV